MTDEGYAAGLAIVEENYKTSYTVSWRMALWAQIKTCSDEEFMRCCRELMRGKFAPKFGDFVDFLRPAPARTETVEPVVCGECRKSYYPADDDKAERECCPVCFAYFKTPEGAAKVEARRARIMAKVAGALDNTDPEREPETAPEYNEEF